MAIYIPGVSDIVMVPEVILGIILNSSNILGKFHSEKYPCSEKLVLVLSSVIMLLHKS